MLPVAICIAALGLLIFVQSFIVYKVLIYTCSIIGWYFQMQRASEGVGGGGSLIFSPFIWRNLNDVG